MSNIRKRYKQALVAIAAFPDLRPMMGFLQARNVKFDPQEPPYLMMAKVAQNAAALAQEPPRLSYAEKHHGEALLVERGKLLDAIAKEDAEVKREFRQMFPDEATHPFTSHQAFYRLASKYRQFAARASAPGLDAAALELVADALRHDIWEIWHRSRSNFGQAFEQGLVKAKILEYLRRALASPQPPRPEFWRFEQTAKEAVNEIAERDFLIPKPEFIQEERDLMIAIIARHYNKAVEKAEAAPEPSAPANDGRQRENDAPVTVAQAASGEPPTHSWKNNLCTRCGVAYGIISVKTACISEDVHPPAPPASEAVATCKAEMHGCPGAHLTCDQPEGHTGAHEMWVPSIAEGREPTRHQWEAASEVPPRDVYQQLLIALRMYAFDQLECGNPAEVKDLREFRKWKNMPQDPDFDSKLLLEVERSRILAVIDGLRAECKTETVEAGRSNLAYIAQAIRATRLGVLDTLKSRIAGKEQGNGG